MEKVNKILLPTDFSEFSHLALEYAVDIAKSAGASLYILNVIEQFMDLSEFYIPNFGVNDFYKIMEESAQKEMDKLVGNIDKEISVESIICSGPPFLEIIRTAKEKSIDLIVISTHGRSGLDHVLFGSVAEKVVRKSPCSVFVVKKPNQKFVMP